MASVHQLIVYQCPSCDCETLIKSDVRIGDRAYCAACGKSEAINQITAPYRAGTQRVRHTGELLPQR